MGACSTTLKDGKLSFGVDIPETKLELYTNIDQKLEENKKDEAMKELLALYAHKEHIKKKEVYLGVKERMRIMGKSYERARRQNICKENEKILQEFGS